MSSLDHKGMNRVLRFSQLSPERQWLVKEMQTLGCGWIKHMIICSSQPLPNPPPKKRFRIKLTGSRRRQAKTPAGDFVLKEPVMNLLDWLDDFGNGTIMVEVSDGLPVDVTIE